MKHEDLTHKIILIFLFSSETSINNLFLSLFNSNNVEGCSKVQESRSLNAFLIVLFKLTNTNPCCANNEIIVSCVEYEKNEYESISLVNSDNSLSVE